MSNEEKFDDEFDAVDEFDADAEFESGVNLKDLWKKNPLFKFGVIIIGLVVIIVSVNMFDGSGEVVEDSVVAGHNARDVRGQVGEEVSDTYREALETRNQQDFEQSVEQGTSFVPVPVDPIQTSIVPVAQESEAKEDPMAQWKELQERRLRRQNEEARRRRLVEMQNQRAMAAMPQNAVAQEARQAALGEAVGRMIEMMANVASRHEHKGMRSIGTNGDPLQYYRTEESRMAAGLIDDGGNVYRYMPPVNNTGFSTTPNGGIGFNNQMQQTTFPVAGSVAQPDLLIEPGEIIYAQLMIEANSDVPSVVMARVMSGHFMGSKILGSFSREEEKIVINFNQIVKDGVSYQVDGVAVDPETSLPGLATEVDRRYFRRVVIPAAVSFIEGVTEAVTDTGTTNIVSTTGDTVATETEDLDLEQELLNGLQEASEVVTEILDEENEDVEILVRVAAGTPMGILFTTPVYDTPNGQPFGAQTFAPTGGPIAEPVVANGTTGIALPAAFDPATLNLVPN